MHSPKIQVFTENFISYIQFLETFGKCIGINSCPNGLDFTPKRSLCFQHNSAQCSKERTKVKAGIDVKNPLLTECDKDSPVKKKEDNKRRIVALEEIMKEEIEKKRLKELQSDENLKKG